MKKNGGVAYLIEGSLTKEEFVLKMGSGAWNDYVIPLLISPLVNTLTETQIMEIVYNEVILPSLRSRGLLCTKGTLDDIKGKLSQERRLQLEMEINSRITPVLDFYSRLSE